VLELDLCFHAEAARVRPYLSVGITFSHPHRLEHLDLAARPIEYSETHRIDRRDEGGGASVHDRRFGSIDFDDSVVDAEPGERRQCVFGGRHERASGIAKHGGKFGGCHRTQVGWDLALLPALEPGAHEAHASIRIGRVQRQGNGQTGMDADPA